MNDPVGGTDAPIKKPWYRKEILVFVSGSLVIAFLLVLVSMALYGSSGAAQLDLSRPGYKSVQSKVEQSSGFEGFSASGTVTQRSIDEFQELYDKQARSVNNKNVFSSNVLDDDALGIGAPGSGE